MTRSNTSKLLGMYKQAVSFEEPGDISRFTSSTLGRALSIPNFLVTPRAWRNPSGIDSDSERGDREKVYKQLASALEKTDANKSLEDVAIRLGGTNTWSNLKRIWGNKRTTLPIKLLATPLQPIADIFHSISRGDNYSPVTNTIDLYNDDPGIFTHQIGHALDFNSVPSEEKSRLSNRIMRDLYGFTRSIPFVAPLVPEARANEKSYSSLKKNLSPEALAAVTSFREPALSADWGAVMGSSVGGGYGALPGAVIGRVVGEMKRNDEDYSSERLNKLQKHLEPKSTKKDKTEKKSSWVRGNMLLKLSKLNCLK